MFESTLLKQRVHKLSVPVRAGRRIAFTRAYRMQPLAQLPAVCATGLAAAAAWSSVLSIWTNPILIDETGTILAGHGRLEAAKRAFYRGPSRAR